VKGPLNSQVLRSNHGQSTHRRKSCRTAELGGPHVGHRVTVGDSDTVYLITGVKDDSTQVRLLLPTRGPIFSQLRAKSWTNPETFVFSVVANRATRVSSMKRLDFILGDGHSANWDHFFPYAARNTRTTSAA
jgi:hypothetical protein